MRKLMWFTIGFASAAALGAYALHGGWLLLMAAACLLLLILAALILQGRGKQTLLVLTGCIIAFVWLWLFDTVYLSHARAYDNKTIEITIEITDYSQTTEFGISAEGRLKLDGRSYKIKLYSYTLEALSPGDVVAGETELIHTQSSGWSESFSSTGIHLVGYIDDAATVTQAENVPIRYFAAPLRQHILTVLNKVFPADTLPFARALLLGDTSLLDYETDTALSISGIRHVVAVSGLHVSILFGLIYTLFGYRKILTPAIGLPLLLLFAALVGFTPSVNRACIMQALAILAMLFDKEYDPPTALSFSVLVMLAINPLAIMSVSLQMSAGCMVGIFLFSRKIRDFFMSKITFKDKKSFIPRLVSWCVNSTSITLSTMITVTPLCAIYFDTVSLISILTNLLTLWVVTVVFCGIVAVSILGSIYIPVAGALAWLLSWLIRYVLIVAELLASFPLAAVYTQSIYIVLWLVFCYCLLTVFLLREKKQPLMLAGCMMLSLLAAVGASRFEPLMDTYRMTVLDVGQGQCIVLQSHDRYYVIDCGGDYAEGTADLAAQTLLSQGVNEIDGLILTHYDDDHAGGVQYFLSRISTEQIYLPAIADDGTVKQTLTEIYTDKICWVPSMTSLSLDDGRLTLFAGDSEKTSAESGLCILYEGENCDILITGDRSSAGEAALLAQTTLPDIEVLVVGHHGSAYSTSFDFLTTTRPDFAIISVGEDNRYHHPAQDTLGRLEIFNCQILRTDLNGTITIKG